MSAQTPMQKLGFETAVPPGEPIQAPRQPEPCTLVIFGGAGDLAQRKLVPALYNMALDGVLPEDFSVIGVGRREISPEAFRALHREATGSHSRRQPIDEALWSRFAERLSYQSGNIDSADTFWAIRRRLQALHGGGDTLGNRLFYAATPPAMYPGILKGLSEAGLIEPPHATTWSRVVMEKPFGRSLETAKELEEQVAATLDERQIFRIDHYLGKETVQNLLVFRLGNSIFEPLWNRLHVDHVQITAAESIGIEGRGAFYDQTGVIRDIVQNHLLQILALVAMEEPYSFGADAIRDEKMKLFRSLRPFYDDEDVSKRVVLGQYRGYREEPKVDPASRTPTYVAMRAYIDNWRWEGVPFYMRAGKALGKRVTEVAIQFKQVPLCLFGSDNVCQRVDPNVLAMRIQPEEGISLRFTSKVPGEVLQVANVTMNFSYAGAFSKEPQEAYERLLLDVMRGDPTHFWRRDALEQAWKIVDPIIEAWERSEDVPRSYAQGSQGPKQAEELLFRDGRRWRPLE